MLKFVVVTGLLVGLALGGPLSAEYSDEDLEEPTSIVVEEEKPSYHVSIGYIDKNTSQYTHVCCGTIISKNWIVTAAHCLSTKSSVPSSDLTVRPVDAEFKIDILETSYQVNRVVGHPHYKESKASVRNNIALVEVAKSIEFNSHRKPVELFGENEQIVAETNGKVTSWDRFNNSLNINLYNVKLVPKKTCFLTRYGEELGYRREICSEWHGAEFLKRYFVNEGGSLTVNGRLAGILSWWRMPGGASTQPVLYTEVASFRAWIKQVANV